MARHPTRMRLLAALCLLLFQLQVFAAEALGCVHAEQSTTPSVAGCPHAVADSSFAAPELGDAPDAPMADCQKCNLGLCAATWHLMPWQMPALPVIEPAVPAPLPDGHFYLFSPDGLLKPPISVSG